MFTWGCVDIGTLPALVAPTPGTGEKLPLVGDRPIFIAVLASGCGSDGSNDVVATATVTDPASSLSVAAPAGSDLAGASVVFPPGVLPSGATVTLAKGTAPAVTGYAAAGPVLKVNIAAMDGNAISHLPVGTTATIRVPHDGSLSATQPGVMLTAADNGAQPMELPATLSDNLLTGSTAHFSLFWAARRALADGGVMSTSDGDAADPDVDTNPMDMDGTVSMMGGLNGASGMPPKRIAQLAGTYTLGQAMFTLTADGHVTLTMPDGMVVEEMWDSEDDVVRGIGFNHGMGEARLDPFESDIVEIAWNTMSTGSQQALRVRYDFRLKEPGPVYIRWKEDTRLSWGRINMGEDPARQDGTRIPLVLLDMVGTWPLHRTVVLSPIADRPYQPSQEVPITINNDGTVVFDGIVFDLVGFFAKDGNSLNLQMSSSANQVGKIVIIIDTDYKPRFQIDRLELHAAGLVQFKAALK